MDGLDKTGQDTQSTQDRTGHKGDDRNHTMTDQGNTRPRTQQGERRQTSGELDGLGTNSNVDSARCDWTNSRGRQNMATDSAGREKRDEQWTWIQKRQTVVGASQLGQKVPWR